MKGASFAPKIPTMERFLGNLEAGNVTCRMANPNDLLVQAGMIDPVPLRALGVRELTFLSKEALENPNGFALGLNGLSNSSDLLFAFVEVGDNAGSGFLTLKDVRVTENPAGFNPDLAMQIDASDADFSVVSSARVNPKTQTFTLHGMDGLVGREVEFQVEVMHAIYQGHNVLTAKADLPYDSPNIAVKLDRMFGLNWFFKTRPTRVTAVTAQQVSYNWAYYMFLNNFQGLALGLRYPYNDPGVVVTALRMDDRYQNAELMHIVYEQVSSGLDGLPPHLAMVRPSYLWDLARAREQTMSQPFTPPSELLS
jgi:hypothetical protein